MTDAAPRPESAPSSTAPSSTVPPGRDPAPIPLGAAPRPVDGANLAARIRDALAAELGGQVVGLGHARIEAVLDGADVASADIDLSGVAVRIDGGSGQAAPEAGSGGGAASYATGPSAASFAASSAPGSFTASSGAASSAATTGASGAGKRWQPDVVRREPGTLRRLRVDAHPIVAVDLPVDVTAELAGLRFDWVEGADGRAGVQPVEPTSDTPVSGHARVAVDKAGLVATVRGVLAVVLLQQGITLTGLDLDIVSQGPRAATLRADAAIKKGLFLSTRVQATATAGIDDNLVLTVRDVQLTSGNPLVAALLGTVRSQVEAATSRDIDLAERLPDGVRLADVRLDVGQQIVVSARLV